MKKARLNLGIRSYDVLIGEGVANKTPTKISGLGRKKRKAILLSDRKLTSARSILMASLSQSYQEVNEISVDAGEAFKEMSSVMPVYGEMLRLKADRDTVLYALGGGSIGDAGGFIASTYLRGIDWVGVPTTLLAQVDSSVGGKTGVNHALGKNLIGSFHQPRLVLCDTRFLKSLGPNEMVSGMGEIIKTAMIFDPKFYGSLVKNREKLLAGEKSTLESAIHQSIRWKCKTVATDEFDRKGAREALNFGHTFGHALESATKYEVFQHGEAVLYGMRFALALSEIRNKMSRGRRLELDHFLAHFPVPKIPKSLSVKAILEKMAQDKKIRQGKIHFVLLKDLGKVVSDSEVKPQDLLDAYALLASEKGSFR